MTTVADTSVASVTTTIQVRMVNQSSGFNSESQTDGHDGVREKVMQEEAQQIRPTEPEAQQEHPSDLGNALMLALQQGQREALAKIYALYNARLYNFIFRIVGDTATAEDIVQETWMTLYERRSEYQTTYKFSTWLFTVARRKALSELRRRSVRSIVRSLFSFTNESDSSSDHTPEPNVPQNTFIQPDSATDQNVLRLMIERALMSLTDHQREIIVLRDIEGFENEEIAEVLQWQIKPGAIRKRIFDAREAFRKAMIREGYIEE